MQNNNEKQTAFFGKITAGITHEINNVLAIIKESSGLIEDIANISTVVSDKYQEKFFNSLSTMKGQLKRGTELVNNLNRFAHIPDNIYAKIDLYEAVKQIIVLASRSARLKNITLEIDPPEDTKDTANIETSPIMLLLALFTAIEYCMEYIPQGGNIIIAPQKLQNKKIVFLKAMGDSSESKPAPEKLSDLTEVVTFLKGSLETDDSSNLKLIFS